MSSEKSDEADVFNQIPEIYNCANARELSSENQLLCCQYWVQLLELRCHRARYGFLCPDTFSSARTLKRFPWNLTTTICLTYFYLRLKTHRVPMNFSKGSINSVSTFSNCFLELMTSNSLADCSAPSFLQFFRNSLPHSNKVPSFHFIQNFNNHHKNYTHNWTKVWLFVRHKASIWKWFNSKL